MAYDVWKFGVSTVTTAGSTAMVSIGLNVEVLLKTSPLFLDIVGSEV